MSDRRNNNPEPNRALDKNTLLDKISRHLPGVLYQFLMTPEKKASFPYATEGVREVFELSPAEVQEDAHRAFSRVHPDDYDRVMETIDFSFNTLNLWKFEFRVVLPRKGASWIRGIARPEKLADGSVLWHGYLREINELKEIAEMIETFFEISPDLLCITDLKGNFIRVNRAWEMLLGYSEDFLITKNSLDFIHPEDEEKTLQTLEEIRTRERALDFVYKHRGRDGEYRHLEWRAQRRGSFIYAAARDITERVHAQQEAAHRNDLLKYIIEHNRSAVAVHDKDLNYLYVSNKYLETFRVKEENIIGKHHYEVFPDLPQKWREVHQRALQGEVSGAGEDPYYRKDGTVDWTQWECRPWYQQDGSVGGIIVYTEVITDRKRMEQNLYREKEQFKTTLLSVGDGVISTTREGRIKVMNPVAETLTGWSLEEALGKPLDQVFIILDEKTKKNCLNPAMKAMDTGEALKLEGPILLISKTGREIPIQDSTSPIKDREGRVTGAVIVFQDFTEERKREKQIEYLSFHDSLTGLYNRRYMEDSTRRLDTPRSLPFSVIRVDVNGLKLTNDAFGHAMGDRLLQEAARILKKCCRAEDILCRTGGDEFDILLPRTTPDEAKAIMARIHKEAAASPVDNMILSLAIGHGVKEHPDQSIFDVLKEADDRMYKNKLQYGRTMRSQVIETLLESLHNKYDQEQLHTEMVSKYSVMLARGMNLSPGEVKEMETAGLLHDIGKIMFPPELLHKIQNLTDQDWEIIRKHPLTGYQLLRGVDEYAGFAEYVLYHHEHWNGSGYPEGLKGKAIPLQARILSVADAYQAMTTPRPYRRALSKEEALGELKKNAGSQFDPEIVRMFVHMME